MYNVQKHNICIEYNKIFRMELCMAINGFLLFLHFDHEVGGWTHLENCNNLPVSTRRNIPED
jgi:hypothetical protein